MSFSYHPSDKWAHFPNSQSMITPPHFWATSIINLFCVCLHTLLRIRECDKLLYHFLIPDTVSDTLLFILGGRVELLNDPWCLTVGISSLEILLNLETHLTFRLFSWALDTKADGEFSQSDLLLLFLLLASLSSNAVTKNIHIQILSS